jgi:cell division septum initiation protein DivIVA
MHRLIAILNESPDDIFQQSTAEGKKIDADSAAQRLLSAAQRTADQLISESRQQATQMLASAEAQADNVKRIVAEEARQMAEESQVELQKSLAQLAEKKEKLIEDCSALSAQLQAGKDQLLSTVEEIKMLINDADTFTFENLMEDTQLEATSSLALHTSESSAEHDKSTDLEVDPDTPIHLSQADLISVDELMDSPPELTLVRNAESNEVWLDKTVKEAEKGMTESDDWDFESPTELIQTIPNEEIISGDRFFEELESEDKVSPLGHADEKTNEAMDGFFNSKDS